ncbi:hypothetical protein BDA99DRAFT_565778 [Phascolomyces articulosus]|uniref:Uncharacterized protein n=1 Tax=Phascolomyces articulosus TaxID=60185 RepID=A0AAD5JWS2_9FUNG|nr:hypothetical protein BDA99DRAFT_565778 [Phascolomyces articulosus]
MRHAKDEQKRRVIQHISQQQAHPSPDNEINPEDDNNDKVNPNFDAYFYKLQQKLFDEIEKSPKNLPQCYKNGNMWIDPPCAPLKFDLKKYGWPTTPRARRIVDLDQNFFIMTYRLQCPNCTHTFLPYSEAQFQHIRKTITIPTGGQQDLKILWKAKKLNSTTFSTFNDPDGYASSVPSEKYIAYMYSTFIYEHMDTMNKRTEALPATILKVDHCHKAFVPSTSMQHTYDSTVGIRQSLVFHGHPLPQFLYTDKVDSDKNFFDKCFHTLNKNMEFFHNTQHEGTNEQQLPFLQLSEDVSVEYHTTVIQIETAIDTILEHLKNISGNSNNTNNNGITIGFDVEWYFNPDEPSCSRVEIIQIAWKRKLENKLGGDLSRLQRDFPRLRYAGKLELDPNIRFSRWSGQLSEHQKNYAALDAWCSLLIYETTKSLPLITTVPVNLEVDNSAIVLSEDPCRPIGIGNISNQQSCSIHKKSLSDFGDPPFLLVVNKQQLQSSSTLDYYYPQKNLIHLIESNSHQSAPTSIEELDDTVDENTLIKDPVLDESWVQDEEIDSTYPQPLQESDSNQKDIRSLEYGKKLLDPIMSNLNDSSFDQSTSSHVLQDPWHALKGISIPVKHSLRLEFQRVLTDTVFLMDKEDAANAKHVLAKKGESFEWVYRTRKAWMLLRVRRSILQSKELIKDVYNVLTTFGPVTFGVQHYFPRGLDSDGFTLYRCSRGTNVLESGVHQNVIRQFGPFNVSAKLAVAMMTEYRTRRNLDQLYFELVGELPQHWQSWVNSSCYVHNKEAFDIVPVTSHFLVELKMDPFDNNKTSANCTFNTSSSTINYLRERQQTRCAILPVRTRNEKLRFSEMVSSFFTDGLDIHYKYPQLLKTYHRMWMQKSYRKSMISMSPPTNNIKKQVQHRRDNTVSTIPVEQHTTTTYPHSTKLSTRPMLSPPSSTANNPQKHHPQQYYQQPQQLCHHESTSPSSSTITTTPATGSTTSNSNKFSSTRIRYKFFYNKKKILSLMSI